MGAFKLLPLVLALKDVVPRLLELGGQLGPLKRAVSDLQSAAEHSRESHTALDLLAERVARLEGHQQQLGLDIAQISQRLEQVAHDAGCQLTVLTRWVKILAGITGVAIVLFIVLLLAR